MLDSEAILKFRCPRWDDLPAESLFNREVVEYLSKTLSVLFAEDDFITQTIIQNYSKRGIIPKLAGRKYEREHIAYLIIILIYKQILSIDRVKQGVDLQLALMPPAQAYNVFALALDQAIQRTFKPVFDQDRYTIAAQPIELNREGVQVIANAFALKLLGTIIIQAEGYRKVGGKDE
ncbi:DUF1836 domain-containing protein [Ignavigranum ruoffiae]